MPYLLQLEWLKFKGNTVFRLMVSLYVVLLPGLFLMSRVSITTEAADTAAALQFPAIWSVLGYLGNWLSFFFLGFFAVYSFTSEFANRTFRQNVITGISRQQLFFAKISFLAMLALLAAVLYALVSLMIGLIASEPEVLPKIWERANLVPRYALMCFGYMSLGVLFSILIRKTTVSVFIYFVYILFFEVLFRWSFHRKIFSNNSMDFYPANAFEDLVPMPLGDWSVTRQFIQNNEGIHFLSGTEAMITSLIYIVIILCWAFYLISRRDL